MIHSTCFKIYRGILLASFGASTVAVADQALFYGEWGIQPQCSRSLITLNGTKHHAPFKISADWLQHGDSWCRLSWVNIVESEGSAYAVARALCGEDDNRNYRVNFSLSGDELTIAWNNEFENNKFENSGLTRC